MDNSLSAIAAYAFMDELEKLGGIAERFPQLAQMGSRIAKPIAGMREGWAALSPTNLLTQKTLQKTPAARDLAQSVLKQYEGNPGFLRRNLGAGAHLAGSPRPTNTLRGAAEHLSRGGWTGQSRVSKYLPIGDKGQLALGAVTAAPGIHKAMREGDTGRGGAGEQIGTAVGGVGAGILTAGIKPSLAIPAGILGMVGAGRLGRGIDRAVASRKQQPVAPFTSTRAPEEP